MGDNKHKTVKKAMSYGEGEYNYYWKKIWNNQSSTLGRGKGVATRRQVYLRLYRGQKLPSCQTRN